MADLSQWDLQFLTPDEQQQVIDYKKQWGNDPTQRDSIHTFVEGIRGKYGYSGGSDGSQYIPIDTWKPPTAPEIPEYKSPYEDMAIDLFSQAQNRPSYVSPYEDLINQAMSDLINRPKFSYNPDTDVAYQAFLQRAGRAGDKAYADNLGGLSAMTGGRPNSWAGTVASQARNEYMLQAQEAVIQFEDRAYSRYRDETSDMYNFVNLLNTQDEIAYSRYRDEIGDSKDLFNMVMQLGDRDFEQFKNMTENTWRRFEYEYNAYTDSLSFKNNEINKAMDRVNLLGFVNNQDSITLGVPVGTLSENARKRAEDMEEYIRKQELDLEDFKKRTDYKYQTDLKLIAAREQSALRASRSGGGGGNLDTTAGYQPTSSDGKKREDLVSSFKKFTESKEFQRMSAEGKYSYITRFIDKIIKDVNDGIMGKGGEWVANEVLIELEGTKAFQEYYIKYENYMANKQNLEDRPLGTLQRMNPLLELNTGFVDIMDNLRRKAQGKETESFADFMNRTKR